MHRTLSSAASVVSRTKRGKSAEISSPPTTSGCTPKLAITISGAHLRTKRSTFTRSSTSPIGATISGLFTPGFVRIEPSFIRKRRTNAICGAQPTA